MSNQKCALLFCFIAFQVAVQLVLAAEKCNHCRGINCQRSSYESVEACPDTLDACVSVFKDDVIEAQGCFETLKELCDDTRMNCDLCVADNCNNRSRGTCVQCVDSEDKRCSTNPESLTGATCDIARSGRNFCYTTITNDQHVKRGCVISLSEQVDCLKNDNCYLCDPSEKSNCNNHLVEAYVDSTEAPPTTESSSSSSSGSGETTSSTSSSTAGPTSSSTTDSSETTSSEDSTTIENTTEDPTTETPDDGGGAASLSVSIFLILACLALYF